MFALMKTDKLALAEPKLRLCEPKLAAAAAAQRWIRVVCVCAKRLNCLNSKLERAHPTFRVPDDLGKVSGVRLH